MNVVILVVVRQTCDAATEFDCSRMASHNCISLAKVCDKRRDCHFAEDENTTLCASRLEHSQLHTDLLVNDNGDWWWQITKWNRDGICSNTVLYRIYCSIPAASGEGGGGLWDL